MVIWIKHLFREKYYGDILMWLLIVALSGLAIYEIIKGVV